MEIGVGGVTNLCCYIRKSPGVVNGNNLLEIYNSKAAKKIRKSILNGSFKYCDLKNCPHYAAGNLPQQEDCSGSIYEEIIKNNTTQLNYVNLWLSFDSRCNLTCISCRNDIVKCNNEQEQKVELLMDTVKKKLECIKHIGLNGAGDPFVSPSMRDFLFNFDSIEYPHIQIALLTNGLLFDEKMWERMRKAQPAIKSVQISVDGATAESYEKIRRGSSFERLNNNLHFLSNLRKEKVINEFIISFVVNAINFREMPEFVRLGKTLACDQIYFSHIVDWGALGKKYNEMAVHLPENKYHQEFISILTDTTFEDSSVELGNIKRYRPKRILRESLFS
ncbi:MAG: hypothetical protein A2103_01135 [Gammaproteobacteria bacterium GWF2_41_13]|nr:MAG: hypothetical protein A2103_01135 [Gammaproteobacteria bacterium GWF2_41_13]